MFRLIKQVLMIVLLGFSRLLATECISLNNEPCMIRLTFIDLNHVELNHYLCIISSDICNASSNAVDDLFTKICVPSETKDVDVRLFNMITKINETKTSVEHISCDCKCKFNITSQIKNGIMKDVNVSVKIIVLAKNIITGILPHVLMKILGI